MSDPPASRETVQFGAGYAGWPGTAMNHPIRAEFLSGTLSAGHHQSESSQKARAAIMALVMTNALDPAHLATLYGRSLLLTQDWSTRDLDALLALASRL